MTSFVFTFISLFLYIRAIQIKTNDLLWHTFKSQVILFLYFPFMKLVYMTYLFSFIKSSLNSVQWMKCNIKWKFFFSKHGPLWSGSHWLSWMNRECSTPAWNQMGYQRVGLSSFAKANKINCRIISWKGHVDSLTEHGDHCGLKSINF